METPAFRLGRSVLMLLVMGASADARPEELAVDRHAAVPFDQLDRDGNGYLSRREAPMHEFPGVFEEADENHDGRLSQREFTRARSIVQKRLRSERIDDAMVTARVKAELSKHPKLNGSAIQVHTDRGHVELHGTVADRAQLRQAIETAAGARGVIAVESYLTVDKSD